MADNIIRNAWIENIDGLFYAACAEAHEVWKGQIFAASTFLLVTRDVGRVGARSAAAQKLAGEMARGHFLPDGGVHRFGMPFVGNVRDLRR